MAGLFHLQSESIAVGNVQQGQSGYRLVCSDALSFAGADQSLRVPDSAGGKNGLYSFTDCRDLSKQSATVFSLNQPIFASYSINRSSVRSSRAGLWNR
ncbi:MAG TPA: hypothetical protein PLZ82_10120 [Smithellaceae bacterium]|nr:hypothetical protein [Smithellaceae bacterium]HQH05747.1 hypothetical protein [Smithellaceae bacterium]HQN67079.1 hypothetical protein [Smithellaceae bacterium]HQP06453.1 hypothetical protein [Smithellaceae bacterium]